MTNYFVVAKTAFIITFFIELWVIVPVFALKLHFSKGKFSERNKQSFHVWSRFSFL